MTVAEMEPIVKPGVKPEIKWFKDAGFGMFVHFGIYAMLEKGEWVMYRSNIPRDEYEKLEDRFNPSKFDAESKNHP